MLTLVLATALSGAVDVQEAALRYFISDNFEDIGQAKFLCLGLHLDMRSDGVAGHPQGLRPPSGAAENPPDELLQRFRASGPRVQPITDCQFPLEPTPYPNSIIADRSSGEKFGVIVRVGTPDFADDDHAELTLEYAFNFEHARGGRARLRRLWGQWMFVGWAKSWISDSRERPRPESWWAVWGSDHTPGTPLRRQDLASSPAWLLSSSGIRQPEGYGPTHSRMAC
jgi:hypothetical protein